METITTKEYIRLVSALIIGIVIGFAIHWFLTRTTAEAPVITTSDESMAMNQSAISGDNGLVVKDQAPGSKVMVDSVKLKSPGWVAIHDNVKGQPGRILGAVLFDKGSATGTVELLRGTVAGKTYFAVLHHDDGDYKNFNPRTDSVLVDTAGAPIMVQFSTTGTTDTEDTSAESATTSVTQTFFLGS
jgi:hypothetical protein